jgi:hypothetical protein
MFYDMLLSDKRRLLKIFYISLISFSLGFFLFSSKVEADNIQATVTIREISSGGGRGGGGSTVEPETRIIFLGHAYPNSKVTLLKDAQLITSTIAGPDAKFEIVLSNLSVGSYVFFIYSEDYQNRRSTPLTFPITITQGVTTTVSGIFITPTIEIDKSSVKKGENLSIFGQGVSNAEVTIAVNSEEALFFKAPTDKNGTYLYNLDTSLLELGNHFVKSKVAFEGDISSFSKIVNFEVGTKNVLKEMKKEGLADINNDSRINLIDFSILAYWYKRTGFPQNIDLNNDGVINLIDFSILAYYWTG